MIKSLFDVFRESMLHNSRGTRKEALDRFLERMRADPAYLEMLARDYFDRMAAVHMVRENPSGGVSVVRTGLLAEKQDRRPVSVEERKARGVDAAKRTERAFTELKARIRNVILLDLELPNGKRLRSATGAECKKAGGFYEAVARHLKPSQVVDKHLTEANLQDIRARYFQRNKAVAA